MNTITTAAIRLLGVSVIVSGVASCAPAISAFVQYLILAETGLADAAAAIGLVVFGSLTFGVFPGLVLVRYGSGIARWVFPVAASQDLAIQLDGSEAYDLGCVLLALWFLVVGASHIFGGVVQAITVALTDGLLGWQFTARSAGSAAAYLGGAYLLFKRTRKRAPEPAV